VTILLDSVRSAAEPDILHPRQSEDLEAGHGR
jgi:hypothetical protein